MNRQQQELTKILKKFDHFCLKYGIDYYLCGGSALGAIRHNGFLPWDDDVDLDITRANYQKLQECSDKLEQETDLVVVDSSRYPHYSNTLVRIVEKKNTMIFQHRMVDKTPKGYFIELFIMDPIPRDLDQKKVWLKKHWVYTELHSISFLSANTKIMDFLDEKMLMEYIQRYQREGKDKVLTELSEELFTVPESESDEYRFRWGINKNIYPISWFGKPQYVPFEDFKLPVPQQVMKCLRADYGDSWMMIPDEEGRITHEDMVDNLDVPYDKYVEDYQQFIDEDAVFQAYLPRKIERAKKFFNRMRSLEKSQELQRMLVLKQMENVSLPLLEVYQKDRKYDAIENIFRIWYKYQFDLLFVQNSAYLDIGDNRLWYALVPLLIRGEWSKARKVLRWRYKMYGKSEILEPMEEYVDGIQGAYVQCDCGEYDGISKYLEKIKMFSLATETFDYQYLSLRMRIEQSSVLCEAECMNILQQGETLYEKYPDKEEILCIMGDACRKGGKKEKAHQYYQECKKKTRNGMIIQYINSIC